MHKDKLQDDAVAGPETPGRPMGTIYKDIMASFGGEIFLFVVSFILGVLTARYLGADGKGRFNVIFYAVSLLSTILSLRFQRSFTYYLSKNKDSFGEIISTSFVVGILSTGIIILFTIYFHDLFYKTIIRGIEVSLTTFVLLCISTYLWNLLNALLAGLQLFKTRAFFMGGSYLLKSVLVVLAIGILRQNLDDLLFLMGIVETIAYLLVIGAMLPRAKSYRINLSAFAGMLKYSLQSFPGVLSDLVTLRVDVFFVNFFAGASQVGIYTVAISMANMLLYVPTAIRNVLLPYVASNSDKDITQKLSRLMVIAMSVFALILIPIVWFALTPIYGEEFGFSRILFLFLLPGTIFWGIYVLLSSDIEGRGLPWQVSQVSMVSAVTTVGLDWLLIPVLGAMGAAIVSSVTYAISMALAISRYHQLTGINGKDILIPKREDFQLLVGMVIQILTKLKKGIFPLSQTEKTGQAARGD